MKKDYLKKTGRVIALALFFIFAVGPLYWIIVTSLKDTKEIYTFPIRYLPSSPSFDSYRKLFEFANFGLYFRNSFLVTTLGALGAMICSIFSGYALSRFSQKKIKKSLIMLLYFTQMVPTFILMTPLYMMMVKVGGIDSLLVLSIVYMVTVLAFCAIMAKSFFDRIPSSLEEAAEIDGCSASQSLFKIILPLMAPGLTAIFSFAFVNIWNELFIAILFISTPEKMTVPVSLNSFISKAGISWDVMSAGLVMALLPTMLIFAIGQKYIVSGLTDGGVKG
ncbi:MULTISPECIES: carbohydrate ABC transporter permease [unclassified Oceanispirochaeta]|uniref:carbohydrate ABC transporter permease n=1 Tax=unclassified Oceanispirochaeta TaxID=2635722 RepID=UPI000E09058B|nr:MULTISPECIES: carbohydrate ABC transporter permease [unclassified Oceanispirochaeta]MBF9017986.1 carbohydrate ABC transporter permease [Oceanispirochaeta sp. M2]NPD74498.1 carbohydrate ABC transporter permease [Oceanispirochaeta sp. M1]RDG29611.1 carbohydrate ABC transporter permease [Oceanispirochaeta sp. M1]